MDASERCQYAAQERQRGISHAIHSFAFGAGDVFPS